MNAPSQSDWRKRAGYHDSDFLILYAGVIGLAQGLDTVLDAAKLLPKDTSIRFLLLGEGPEKERLIERKQTEKIERVDFPEAVKRETMPEVIHAVNAAVVPLKKMDLFLGAIPSKIFESLALGKPILLGVDGEARTLFIDQDQCGIYVEPENATALAKGAQQLSENPDLVKSLGENGRKTVESKFMRENITLHLCTVLEEILKSPRRGE
jgi:glycosyltransferase involved in cell wall biosynthesis